MNTNPTILRDAVTTTNSDAEVSAKWLSQNRGCCRLVDVREPHELSGPLGNIDGVENVPLLTLLSQAEELDHTEALVLICRSGRRSGEASRLLREAGHSNVASVEGGMIAWNTDVFGNATILADEKAANTANLTEAANRLNGLPEVSAQWAAANIGRFRLIDVREPRELVEHGKVAQSENIPLTQFMESAQRLDREAPLVIMCASGGRSGRVVRALESAGFRLAASMEGGMFGWKATGLAVARSALAEFAAG
jgi:rhodanese-related sulfurtransferase